MNSILHIAPELPPAVDGVGDYCWHLWRHWPEPASWQFAAQRNVEATRETWSGAQVHLVSPNAGALSDMLNQSAADTVVLHYVGYGYHPKGVPLWLPAGLEAWRRGPARKLVTMFHEMYADSSPLRSPFWVKPWARQVIRRLVRASDAWITSCERYSGQLTREFGAEPGRGSRIPIAPNVPSAENLNEDQPWPLESGRRLRVVVFGLANTRLQSLSRHERFLRSMVAANLVDSILLLGKSDGSPRCAARMNEIQRRIGGEWRSAFDLSPRGVSDALAGCDIGLVANEPDILTKSGVFAALTTNGVVSVVANRPGASVPSPFNDCVLLNDDQVGFDSLLDELPGANRMTARRRATLRAAREELSWDRVAHLFQEAIEGARGATGGRDSNLYIIPEPSPLEQPQVRA